MVRSSADGGDMVEVLGAATAIGMAAATARFGMFMGQVWARVRDELRFSHIDRSELNNRFARIIGEKAPFDD